MCSYTLIISSVMYFCKSAMRMFFRLAYLSRLCSYWLACHDCVQFGLHKFCHDCLAGRRLGWVTRHPRRRVKGPHFGSRKVYTGMFWTMENVIHCKRHFRVQTRMFFAPSARLSKTSCLFCRCGAKNASLFSMTNVRVLCSICAQIR